MTEAAPALVIIDPHRVMRPCPSCALPFEHGEVVCARCLSRLPADRHPLPAHDYFALRRRKRVVEVVGKTVMLVGLFGVVAVQATMSASVDLHDGRDLFGAIHIATATLAWYVLIGAREGSTLNHYASAGAIRRGARRWWKTGLPIGVFAVALVVSNELVQRPLQESRRGRAAEYSVQQVDWAIELIVLASYAGGALLIAWALLAAFLGPQLMGRHRRKHLFDEQRDLRETGIFPWWRAAG